MGIIIAAGVLVAGMNAVGLVSAFLGLLKEAGDAARWAAAFGPFLLAIITSTHCFERAESLFRLFSLNV